MKDVAEKAGVSIATVSRILSEDKSLIVTDETRQRILQTANDLNYVRRSKKNNHASQKAYKFLIVQWYNEAEELVDVYYLSIRSGIEKRLDSLGMTYVKRTFNSQFDEMDNVDGIIALGKFDEEEVDILQSIQLPLLFVDFDASRYGETSILIDFSQGVGLALDYLLSAGHERIGIITGREKTRLNQSEIEDERFKYFKSMMEATKKFNSQWVVESDFTNDGGYIAMKNLLESSVEFPSAFFVSSDAMAIGAMRAVQEKNIRVPEDISFIGFNDINVSKYVSPALTTIKVHTEWMGELAVSILCDLIENTPPVARKIIIETSLVIRNSVSKATDS